MTRQRPRSDALRNRQRLLDATGEVLRTQPQQTTMPHIAERAGLSIATAYRYFSNVEDLLNAYLHGVIIALRDHSHDSPRTGTALFRDVAHEWARLLRTYGTAMVQLRSREGFLRRLREHDPIISSVRDAWERPIRTSMRELGVTAAAFDHALFLCNIMFDPRELLDLTASGLPEAEALDHLTAAYFAALKAWASASTQAGHVQG